MLIDILVLTLFALATSVAAILKYTGNYKPACVLRVGLMTAILGTYLYNVDTISDGLLYGLLYLYVLNWAMFLWETLGKQKIYKSYMDVPRQTLYKVLPSGKCQVLNERQAKREHEKGVPVYIHAMARITYNPKGAEAHMDKGMGTDRTGVMNMQTGERAVEPQRKMTPQEILQALQTIHKDRQGG